MTQGNIDNWHLIIRSAKETIHCLACNCSLTFLSDVNPFSTMISDKYHIVKISNRLTNDSYSIPHFIERKSIN